MFAQCLSCRGILIHRIYYLQLKKFLPLIFSPPESQVDFTVLGSLENILLKQPVQGPCILNDKARIFVSLSMVVTRSFEGIAILLFGVWERDARPSKLLQNFQVQTRRRIRQIPFHSPLLLADVFLAFGLPANLRPDLPFLFLWGTRDSTVIPSVIAKSSKFISKYQGVALEGKGQDRRVDRLQQVGAAHRPVDERIQRRVRIR